MCQIARIVGAGGDVGSGAVTVARILLRTNPIAVRERPAGAAAQAPPAPPVADVARWQRRK